MAICDNCIHDEVCGLEGHLDEALTFCLNKVADVQPVDRWIAVTEKLPEIDKYVLIYYPYWTDNEIQVARLCYDKLTFDICGEFNAGVNKVTHWRPLPEPPEALKR